MCKYQSFWGWGCEVFWVAQKWRLEGAGGIPEGFAVGYGLFWSSF